MYCTYHLRTCYVQYIPPTCYVQYIPPTCYVLYIPPTYLLCTVHTTYLLCTVHTTYLLCTVHTTYVPAMYSTYHLPAMYSTYRLPAMYSTYRLPAMYSTYHLPAMYSTYHLPAMYSTCHLPAVYSTYHLPAVYSTSLCSVCVVLSCLSSCVPLVRRSRFDCQHFMERYKDRFLQCVDSHAISNMLLLKGLIPSNLSHQLQNVDSTTGTQLVFLHLRSHADIDSLLELCNVMINLSGYPNMSSLGQVMKWDLELFVNIPKKSSTCPFVVSCVVLLRIFSTDSLHGHWNIT